MAAKASWALDILSSFLFLATDVSPREYVSETGGAVRPAIDISATGVGGEEDEGVNV